MKIFFRVHNYYDNMKARVATFDLKGKVDIWWENLKNVKGIREKELLWKEFEEHFRGKCLSKRYFDNKEEDFYELKMGQMSYDKCVAKFLRLL